MIGPLALLVLIFLGNTYVFEFYHISIFNEDRIDALRTIFYGSWVLMFLLTVTRQRPLIVTSIALLATIAIVAVTKAPTKISYLIAGAIVSALVFAVQQWVRH